MGYAATSLGWRPVNSIKIVRGGLAGVNAEKAKPRLLWTPSPVITNHPKVTDWMISSISLLSAGSTES
jgi:hypothetical protein